MTDFIDDIIKREGEATNDPLDAGGRTMKGISEKSNPEAWADGKVTDEEARAIYQKKYVDGPGFSKIQDIRLMAQLTDFGVLSGPQLAIMKLQHILKTDEDGVIGPHTLQLLTMANPTEVNNLLVGERVKMIGRILSKHPEQVRFASGWLNRCVDFIY